MVCAIISFKNTKKNYRKFTDSDISMYRRDSIITSFEPLRQLEGGHVLVFKFVRGDGVQRQYPELIA